MPGEFLLALPEKMIVVNGVKHFWLGYLWPYPLKNEGLKGEIPFPANEAFRTCDVLKKVILVPRDPGE